MLLEISFLLSVVGCAAADWTTRQWDAIVVGAGPAGIIVATRMAEANLSTLLLEGGGASYGVTGGNLTARRPAWLDSTNLTRVDVPGLYKSIFADGDDLVCGNLTNAFGGCTIGGSSAINAGLFFQPPASDWDLYFPDGWRSDDMTTAIDKLYAMQPSVAQSSFLQSGYDAARRWLVDRLGFKDVGINDAADDKTEVFGHPVFDYGNGQRGGPTVTYLQKALTYPNFRLQSGTRALRVERDSNNATGVMVNLNGTETLIGLSAKGRVVLSGGAIQSPALLMYSGIGAPAVLANLSTAGKLGNLSPSDWINTTVVGKGLFDNPNTFIELAGPTVKSYVYSYGDPPMSDEDAYLLNRTGPYSFASETSVFWDTLTRSDGTVAGFQGTIDSSGYEDYTKNNTITLNIYGTSGLKSRGRVVLDSNFIPGPDGDVYYSAPTDGPEIAGFIYKIFQGLNTTDLRPLNIAANATVDDIATYITTSSAYAKGMVNHWSSSCAIGDCVDAAGLRVVGMENLHVVDASIVEPLTVNPQFGIMAAAERGAELILRL